MLIYTFCSYVILALSFFLFVRSSSFIYWMHKEFWINTVQNMIDDNDWKLSNFLAWFFVLTQQFYKIYIQFIIPRYAAISVCICLRNRLILSQPKTFQKWKENRFDKTHKYTINIKYKQQQEQQLKVKQIGAKKKLSLIFLVTQVLNLPENYNKFKI